MFLESHALDMPPLFDNANPSLKYAVLADMYPALIAPHF
jgi:hypothetical protein